jgi:two-component system OmpR family sensor kinase
MRTINIPKVRAWRQWTLRTRLGVAIAVLAAIALVVANLAGWLLLRHYLMGQIDNQLTKTSGISAPRGYGNPGGNPGDPGNPGNNGGRCEPAFHGDRGIGPAYRFLTYDANGVQQPVPGLDCTYVSASSLGPGPELGSWAQIQAHADTGRPYTVDGADGEPWRVIAWTSAPTTDPNDITTHVTAISLKDVQNTSHTILEVDLILTVLMLVAIGIAAASVVRIGLMPLTRMEVTATEIASAEDLSIRVEDVDQHTETGRLGTALNAMLVRIEGALDARTASEQRLRQFLADASHELRTPLTSIQGFAELYRRGGTPPGPELDEAMGRIESEVVRMRVLVNDLLQLARLDEERPMGDNPVDLLGVAAETVRDAHVRVPRRFVQLAALDDAFDTFEPVTVLGDDDRLRQVATNLVNNALQHTGDDARVVVRVGRPSATATPVRPTAAVGREIDRGTPVVVLEVTDTGPGMSPEEAQRVFERLYRVERSRDRRHGGAGLGLAIVAAIVVAHHGRVELVTELGAGSTFRVVLPAAPDFDDDYEQDDSDSKLPPSFPEVSVEAFHS